MKKEKVYKIIFTFIGFVMIFRFGITPFLQGADAVIVFDKWMIDPTQASKLLDSDLRFFGAVHMGLGYFFFWLLFQDFRKYLPFINIMIVATFFGVLARIWAMFTIGIPENGAIIATVLEVILCTVYLFLYLTDQRKKIDIEA